MLPNKLITFYVKGALSAKTVRTSGGKGATARVLRSIEKWTPSY
jgi:hypothetical protein